MTLLVQAAAPLAVLILQYLVMMLIRLRTFLGLTVGEVSPVVNTSFGYQIFKVTDDNSDDVPTMESMREELTAAKEYKRQTIYADKVTAINDLAADGFSIEDIAQQENVTLKRINDYRKENNTSILAQPALIKQAFDDFTIQDQAVTTGIEVGNGMVWAQPTAIVLLGL